MDITLDFKCECGAELIITAEKCFCYEGNWYCPHCGKEQFASRCIPYKFETKANPSKSETEDKAD